MIHIANGGHFSKIFLFQQSIFEPSKFRSTIEVEAPTTKIYRFHGAIIHPSGGRVPVGTDNLLLRECLLKNTDFVEGIVVYAGKVITIFQKIKILNLSLKSKNLTFYPLPYDRLPGVGGSCPGKYHHQVQQGCREMAKSIFHYLSLTTFIFSHPYFIFFHFGYFFSIGKKTSQKTHFKKMNALLIFL